MGILGKRVQREPPAYLTWQNNTNSKWWHDPSLKRNAFWMGILYLGLFISGYDGAMLNGLQAMPAWKQYFHSPAGNRLGLISASGYLPAFAAAPIVPWMADKYSRIPVIMTGCAVIILGAFINGFANGDGMFIAGRAIIGFGNSFKTTGCALMISELAHPRLRGSSAALYNCFFYFGSTIAAWLCFGLVLVNKNWAWRLPLVLQCAGPVVLLIGCFWMPQSPRWLMSQGRREEAHKILADLHANGSMEDELVNKEVEEIANGLIAEKENKQITYLDFFRTKGNRMRLLIILTVGTASQWVGNGVVAYYLAPILKGVGVTNPRQVTAINIGLAMFNLVISSSAASFVDRIGRRPLWIIGFVGMLVTFSMVTGFSAGYTNTGNAHLGVAVVPLLYIFYGFYDISLTPLPYLYIPEILPFSLRSKGLTLVNVSTYAALAFNQWVNPVALAAIQWRLYAVYVGLITFYLILILLFFRETAGLSLEETATLFDKPKGDRRAAIQSFESGHVLGSGKASREEIVEDDVKEDPPYKH